MSPCLLWLSTVTKTVSVFVLSRLCVSLSLSTGFVDYRVLSQAAYVLSGMNIHVPILGLSHLKSLANNEATLSCQVPLLSFMHRIASLLKANKSAILEGI